jgi:tetratricopeptide (TPR) repeat protein
MHAQTALDLAERSGDVFGRIQSLLALGESYLWEESFEDAIELLQAALELARERHANLFAEASMLGLLADAYRGAGQLERALAMAEEAVAVRGAPSIQALQALTRCLLAGGSREEQTRAESLLEQADSFIEQSGARSWEPHLLVTRAELARLRGNEDERDRNLERAVSLLQEMGATGHAEQVGGTR